MSTERHIAIPTDDGTMETFIVHPDGDGPFPAVVMYQNVRGLSEQLREVLAMTRSLPAPRFSTNISRRWAARRN